MYSPIKVLHEPWRICLRCNTYNYNCNVNVDVKIIMWSIKICLSVMHSAQNPLFGIMLKIGKATLTV